MASVVDDVEKDGGQTAEPKTTMESQAGRLNSWKLSLDSQAGRFASQKNQAMLNIKS